MTPWAERVAKLAVFALLTLVLAALLAAVATGLVDDTLASTDLIAIAGVVVAIGAAALAALYAPRRNQDAVDEAAGTHASALTRKTTRELDDEHRDRGLNRESRMAVRWQRIGGGPGGSRLADALPETGLLDQLTEAYVRHAHAGDVTRLVVTGEAGAGKTAACLLLARGLAEPDQYVPVLFPLASYHPDRLLTQWMADELITQYSTLGYDRRGRAVADELLRHRVLPVLDGLDEVSDPAAVLRRIEDELVGRPLVLSCRTEACAGLDDDRALSGAVVVELQPMGADEAVAVLRAAGSGFQALIDALTERPTGPLARALDTPFMLSLAVRLRGALPGELLSATEPEAEERIKRTLLGTFIDRAYPRTRDNDIPCGDARRWLAFLARRADPGTARIAWWQLHRAVPRAVYLGLGLVNAVIACSATAAALFSLFDRPWLGLFIGAGAALVGVPVVELVPQDDPRRAKPRLRSVRPPSRHALLRVLGFGAVGGVACAVIVWFLYEEWLYLVIGGLLSATTFAAARYFSEPSDPLDTVTPVGLLGSDRATVLYAWLTGAVPGALTGAYLGASIDAGHRTPQLDDVTLIERLPTAAEALLGAAAGAVLSATGLGMMAIGSSAWGRFVITRGWLALRGHTPYRLMTFLEDGRRRGVLRQANGYYEFRHRMLQSYLAEETERAAAGAPDTSTGPPRTQ